VVIGEVHDRGEGRAAIDSDTASHLGLALEDPFFTLPLD
jgi:hypothetical protein